MGGSVFVLCVDSSKLAHKAASWCCKSLVQPGDTVHLLVASPAGQIGGAATPIAASRNRAAGLDALANTKAVHEVLHLVNERVSQEQFQISVVKAGAGSKGIAAAIVRFARQVNADLVVLGSRGMAEMTSSALSLLGFGSVSSLCVQNAPCPVAIVRGTVAQTHIKGEQQVLLLVEPWTTHAALQWTLDHVVQPVGGHLHMLCVGQPTTKLAELAGKSLSPGQVHIQGLPEDQSPFQLGQAAGEYAQQRGISIAVLSRLQQSGGLARALLRLAGRSSVGDLLLKRLSCPVIVLRE